VKLIACGRYHTLLATVEGNIYSFGSNSDFQLGLGSRATESFYSTPQRIQTIDNEDWVMVAAGSSHSCALSSNIFQNMNQIKCLRFLTRF
jgi:alpha-tubulin suppressor-like RCC1 family protein